MSKSFASLSTNNTRTNTVDSGAGMILRVIFYFSPLMLMCFMMGSAIMSGTPFVFLFYFLALFLALLFRHLIWMLFGSTPVSRCGNEVYLPFVFSNYKEFMSTFVFVFSIVYVFGPYFNWKQASESSIFMFVLLIVYAVYDMSVRTIVSKCMSINRATVGSVFGNALMGGALGAAAQAIMMQLGLSKFMYYSNSANRPTKKVFRCGKVKK
jgi:hypothetical protein